MRCIEVLQPTVQTIGRKAAIIIRPAQEVRWNAAMIQSAQKLLEEALRLSEDDRAALAARLIESLEEPEEPDARDAWDQEIARRLERLDRGEVKTIPWAEARTMIRGESDAASNS